MIKTIISSENVNELHPANQEIYNIAQRVYEQLGTGHTEFIYHRALEIELRNKNYTYETEKRVLISYTDGNGINYTLGEERIDIYLHQIPTIIELKAVVNQPKENEIAQLFKYFREFKNTKFGVIINFPQCGTKAAKSTIDFIEVLFN